MDTDVTLNLTDNNCFSSKQRLLSVKRLFLPFLLFLSRRMAEEDWHGILGVQKDASEGEIRKAYLKLAQKYHPDKNPREQDRDRFKLISSAYQNLSGKRDHLDERKEEQSAKNDVGNTQTKPTKPSQKSNLIIAVSDHTFDCMVKRKVGVAYGDMKIFQDGRITMQGQKIGKIMGKTFVMGKKEAYLVEVYQGSLRSGNRWSGEHFSMEECYEVTIQPEAKKKKATTTTARILVRDYTFDCMMKGKIGCAYGDMKIFQNGTITLRGQPIGKVLSRGPGNQGYIVQILQGSLQETTWSGPNFRLSDCTRY